MIQINDLKKTKHITTTSNLAELQTHGTLLYLVENRIFNTSLSKSEAN